MFCCPITAVQPWQSWNSWLAQLEERTVYWNIGSMFQGWSQWIFDRIIKGRKRSGYRKLFSVSLVLFELHMFGFSWSGLFVSVECSLLCTTRDHGSCSQLSWRIYSEKMHSTISLVKNADLCLCLVSASMAWRIKWPALCHWCSEILDSWLTRMHALLYSVPTCMPAIAHCWK